MHYRRASRPTAVKIGRSGTRCGVCGRFMQGAVSGGRTYYRCKFPSEYALSTEVGHASSVNLREDDLLPHLDAWLAATFGADHINETCAVMASGDGADEVADTSAIKTALRECERKLDRYRQALEAGTDPTIVAAWISQVTKERAGAQARLAEAELRSGETVTPAELRAQIEAIGGLLLLLNASDPSLKARFYDEVGIEGLYDPETQSVAVEARVLNGRVGGGT